MTKNREFLLECANNPFDYRFSQNSVVDIDDARANGINCVSTVQLHTELNGYYLPKVPPYELFHDVTNIATVPSLNELLLGDIVWHGPERADLRGFVPRYDSNDFLINWKDGFAQHLSIFAGRKHDGEPVFVHASFLLGMTVASTLREISRPGSSREIYRVGRPIRPLGSLVVPTLAEIISINKSSHSSSDNYQSLGNLAIAA